MQFALRINPGREAQKFLDERVAALGKLSPADSMSKLDEEIKLIFTGRFDKLKTDSRFNQYFLAPCKDIHDESTTRGGMLIGAFDIMNSVYSENARLSADPQAVKSIQEQYFLDKLKQLEMLFAAELGVFNRYFIQMFLSTTYSDRRAEGAELEQLEARFEEFLSEQDILLNFYFWLQEFNRLNQERTSLDLKKKGSLSQRLEEQINHGSPLADLRRQIMLCGILKGIARRLIDIAEGHTPLDKVKRVLGEIYEGDEEDQDNRGVLDRFQEYYRIEIEKICQSLVYKRIIFLNAGHKEAVKNRKKWISEIDLDTAEKLVQLLQVPETQGKQLSGEQQVQAKLVATMLQKIAECRQAKSEEVNKAGGVGKDGVASCLDEQKMNLLVLRLANNSMLEIRIAEAENELAESNKLLKLEQQNTLVRTYDDNIKRLTQCCYFYLSVNALKNKAVENRSGAVLQRVRNEIIELETALEQRARELQCSQCGETPGSYAEPAAKAAVSAEQSKDGLEKKKEKIDLSTVKDPQLRAEILAGQLKDMMDSNKIKPLKELAYTGNLDTLKYILPLSQYRGEFLRNLARNTVIKIVLRLLRENEENPVLGIKQKKKLIEFVIGLDKRFAYLRDMEITNQATIQKILDILIREDKDFTARTLADIIVDEDDKVRATAVKLIAEMLDQHEGSLLMKMLNDKNARVRANVIESLEAIGNRNVLGILMKYKYDRDNRCRANALKAIWNFGHKDINESLEDMLISTDAKMRASAAWLIGEIGQGQFKLKSMLKVIETDTDELVQRNVKLAKRKIERREEGIRIIIADDDVEFCKTICGRLIHEGFKATSIYNGKALLAAAERSAPDLILMDLRLPLVNGLEVLKTLKGAENTAGTPVIVMSDLNSTVLLKQITKAGANDYLIKPCNYEQIRDRIKPFV